MAHDHNIVRGQCGQCDFVGVPIEVRRHLYLTGHKKTKVVPDYREQIHWNSVAEESRRVSMGITGPRARSR